MQKLYSSEKLIYSGFSLCLVRIYFLLFFTFILSFGNELHAQLLLEDEIETLYPALASYGISLDMSEDYLVVGASNNVLVYEKDASGAWVNEQKLQSLDWYPDASFGSKVRIQDDYIVISAKSDNDNGMHAGAVYIYEKDVNGYWGKTQKIIASDGALYDNFGGSIDVYENRLAVSSLKIDTTHIFKGKVYLYERDDEGNWGNEQIITTTDVSDGSFYGASISLSEQYLAVGARADDQFGFESGSVFLYELDANGNWGNETKFHPSDPIAEAGFGSKLKFAEGHLMVSAITSINAMNVKDAVYVYELDANGNWSNEQKIVAPESSDAVFFGSSFDLSTDNLLIGDDYNQENGHASGAVFHYKKTTAGTWVLEQKIMAFGGDAVDQFGATVAAMGDDVAIGAPGYYDSGFGSGLVYYGRLDDVTSIHDVKSEENILHQNTPNPFTEETNISFELAEAGVVRITISDISGRIIRVMETYFTAGLNTILIEDLEATGLLNYTIQTNDYSASKKMLLVE